MRLVNHTRDLPQFVRDLRASVPRHGAGVPGWPFRRARVRHPSRAESEITAAPAGCRRVITARDHGRRQTVSFFNPQPTQQPTP
jgi:hypothetical protein